MNERYISENKLNILYRLVTKTDIQTIWIDENSRKMDIDPNYGIWGNFNLDYMRERIQGEELTTKKDIKELLRQELIEWQEFS